MSPESLPASASPLISLPSELPTLPSATPPQPGFWIRVFGAGLGLGILTGVVLGFGLGLIFTPGHANTAPLTQQNVAVAPVAAAQPTSLPDVDVAKTTSGIAPYRTMGKADAPVKIVLFEDPQCPYCHKMSTGPVKDIITQYVDTGKATLSYRHSLFLGPESFAIAAAMDCAGEQGKFWEFHDQAYGSQQPENGGLVDDAMLSRWAKSAGVANADAFTACAQKGKTAAKPSEAIQTDLAASAEFHVTGTPTLFINGKRLIGYTSLDFIQASIEEQLSKAASAGQ